MTRQTFGNGCYTQYLYDSSDRLTTLTQNKADGTVLQSESYGFDVASRLGSKTVDGVQTAYSYDNADELLTESRPGYSASYTYDANGNRLSRVVNGLTDSFTYDPADKILSAVSGGVSQAYGYDGAGRMTSLRNGQIELQYDYDDRVLSMTSGGVYTAYLYNGLGTRVATTQGAMKWLRRDGAGVTSSLLSDGDYSYNQGISRMSGSTVTSTHADMLGSLNLETNSSENVSATRSFDAFGNLLSTTGSPQGMLGYAGAWGYEEDPSGLKLLGHRWYDSFSGRFLTRDPAQDGRNWYDYAANRPTWYVDPSGLQSAVGLPKGRPDNYTFFHWVYVARRRRALAMQRYMDQLDPFLPGSPQTDNLRWFYSMVRPGGPMDFKRQESRKGPRKERLAYWGNFNYGAIGSALGLSPRELHQAAGLAAVAVNHGRPYTPLGSHYAGDEKRDSDGIDAGINWYRKNYPND